MSGPGPDPDPARGITDDGFLGGRLRLLQPAKGFRSGVDAVLLAGCVAAKPGESALELGCGVGAAMLCLGARVPDMRLAGLELQEEYAELARRNAARNGIHAEIHSGDLRAMPDALKQRRFDHVLANPPYYLKDHWTAPDRADRAVALGETADLADWLDAAARRLRPGGYVHVIQKASRFADLLAALDGRFGALELKPVAPRPGRAAELVILRARKGARTPPRLFSPLVLHGAESHLRDGSDWTAEADGLLRNGAVLEF